MSQKKTMNQTKFAHLYLCVSFQFLYLSDRMLVVTAQDEVTYLDSYCGKDRYDDGSEYANNVDMLLSNLTSEASTKKFYNLTSGKTSNKVYGLYLCNTFSTNQVCQDCMTLAQGEIRLRCKSSTEAIVWYIECMLRYANYPIFSINNDSIARPLEDRRTKFGEFKQELRDTFISLVQTATTGNSSSSLASATTTVYLTTDISMSCYVDCTPDLSASKCKTCLQSALSKLPTPGRSGVLLQPSCRLMYSFNDARPILPDKRLFIALGVISAVAAASLVMNVFAHLKRRKAVKKPTGLDEIESRENLQFDFEAIRAATDNFAAANKLGQGGFGVVYMGALADGQAVAVKRLSNASSQGIKEFKTEACLAARLQHKNLVKVFGFCLEGNEMLLIYEFMPNKSLDRYLFGPKGGAYLKWEARHKIIVGIARGLQYLHEDSRPKIIHRDLKPSNILLDGDMNPKIADFGMAKCFGVDETHGNTSRVAGTFGYMSPEYATTGHFSVKSDIFSYGVILLEIVSGQKNSFSDTDDRDENLLHYAWRLWQEKTHLNLVDSAFGNDFSKDEVERCIYIGLLCIQEDPAKRPNIASVLLMLNTQPINFPPPSPPPALPYSKEKQAASHESLGTQAEDDITDLLPR